MPELPEVETIVRALQNGGRGGDPLPGKRVKSVTLLWPRSLAEPTPRRFQSLLAGEVVEAVTRRGKYIIIRFKNAWLLIHLRMSGDLRVEMNHTPPGTHDRVLFRFEDGTRLAFEDARKFGRLWLVSDPQTVLGRLGPEPLDGDFSAERLLEALHKRHRQLKPLLLDQAFLAGLGNIYTDEALHVAQLHPLATSSQVTPAQGKHLWEGIRQVLQEGIERNGASIDWVYRGGDFQNHFRVYQRTGKPCPVCGTTIERLVVGQRGTHFCPTCQPRPPDR